MQIGYNMQYSTISRELIERLRPHGPFFDSPYPDFFATNVAFLTARAIVVDPRPLVAIGICPRSFGAYFFSDRESEGIEMLMNEPDDASRQRLARVVLPGLQHYTSWLFAMQRLVDRYGDAYGLRVDYRRYRLLQIGHAYARLRRGAPDARERLRELQQRLSPLERWGYAIAYGLLAPLLRRGGSLARSVRRLLRSRVGPYPEIEVAVRPTPHRDILSLFRALPAPDKADSAGAPAVAAANDPVGEPGATPHAS
ncbi:MAG: hypothetical protein D6776_10715 [Planctomycetota bacterium]|nr:MAG: hypothetical protein D6776_10715 [Planctomycetota bacterium]